jgi:hypothetical protein
LPPRFLRRLRGLDPFSSLSAYHAQSPGFRLADLLMMQEQAGEVEAARETAAELLAVRPRFSIGSWLRTQFRSDVDQMLKDLASLRAVGIPEQTLLETPRSRSLGRFDLRRCFGVTD